MSHDTRLFLLTLPTLVVAMTLHELAHGWVAWRLGDPTAKLLGRLTLNPLRHLDTLGTAMFAITYFGAASVGEQFMFGWAKPVPVVPGHFRSQKRGLAIVAVAGPAVNLLFAIVLAAVLVHAGPAGIAGEVIGLSLIVNVVLGVFNLLPVPPLDGSRIVGAVMGDRTYALWSRFDRYGMVVLLAAFIVFRDRFQDVLGGATTRIVDALVTAVGG